MNHELIVTFQANGLAPPAWRQVFCWILVPKPTLVERTISAHENLLALAANVLKLRHELLEIAGWQGKQADCGANSIKDTSASGHNFDRVSFSRARCIAASS